MIRQGPRVGTMMGHGSGFVKPIHMVFRNAVWYVRQP